MPKNLVKKLRKFYLALEQQQKKREDKSAKIKLGKNEIIVAEPVSSDEYVLAASVREAAKREELIHIIENEKIQPVYQPIVNLKTGHIMGYEALARGPASSLLAMPTELFAAAIKHKQLLSLEQVCREAAISNFKPVDDEQFLFLNMNPEVIDDPEFRNGRTKQIILQQGLAPERVTFEITERTAILDFGNFSRALMHYRQQGYCIAVDDAGAGYSSLQAIAELCPQYIKLDMSIVRDIQHNPFKRAIVESMVNLALAMNSQIIAEGVETADELLAVAKLGVHYAQGYFLARPAAVMPEVSREARQLIGGLQKKEGKNTDEKRNLGMGGVIGDIVEHVPTITPEAMVSSVEEVFTASSSRGVVVLEGRKPVGLLMKNRLYYHLGTYYGVSLYHRRSVERVMDKNPLIVNADLPLEAVARIAIGRDESTLYDLIIVVKEDRYVGVVSIMTLLSSITEIKVRCAHNSNPLTGLPGNLVIDHNLRQLVEFRDPWAVVYVDLNNFKAYNDKYGFEKGDKVLLLTSEILSRSLAAEGRGQDSLGHIGGDDFIIITGVDRVEALCRKILDLFDREIPGAYEEKDLARGYIQVKNRKGNPERFPVMTISLAVVTSGCRDFVNYLEIASIAADLKKAAKQCGESCMVIDRRSNRKTKSGDC